MSQIESLMQSLSLPQREAVAIVKLSLDCFNSMDGSGLFTGVSRYNVLAQRLPLAAVQARDMHGFWAGLLRKMHWPVPPKKADQKIIDALIVESPRETLKVLATEAVSIITLARVLHDQDKKTRKELQAEFYGSSEKLYPEFDDSLEGLQP